MSGWLEAYERLPEDAKARVQQWLHLQRMIAETLRVPWERWIDHYIGYAMSHPFDYRFMEAAIPNFVGLETTGGFTTQLDPATALVARVPLRAQNNLGRLSPELQDTIAALLERTDAGSFPLLPSDVALLQKIFFKEKSLARLKKQSFKDLVLERDGDDLTISLPGGEELLRMNVLEFGATMSKALV